MNRLACAECIIESDGRGRPPAVTIREGTALCVEHLLERRCVGDSRPDRVAFDDMLVAHLPEPGGSGT